MEPTKAIDVSDCGHDFLLDRISQLPDSVLNLILCKVMEYTTQVVQTMILSKTWQNLWAPVAYLCFHDSVGDFPNIASFVNTVLQLRDPSDIHTFRVQWRHSVDAHRDHHLIQWAEHIVRCNVKVLELDIYAGEHAEEVVEFPCCIFTCQTLEVLKLETEWMRTKLSPRSIVQLSRLRKLHLIGFYADCDSLKNLISGCPVLEDLEFVECNLEDPEVSSDTLRQLIIKSRDISGTRMRISCPNLRSVCVYNIYTERLELLWENVSSVVDATIQIDDRDGNQWFAVNVDAEPLKSIITISKYVWGDSGLQIFSNVERLKHKVQHMERIFFPIFCNLKRLKLYGNYMEENYATVVYFLQHSPSLELLTLQRGGLDSGEEKVRWYGCPHCKPKVDIFGCDEENEKLMELMTYFTKQPQIRVTNIITKQSQIRVVLNFSPIQGINLIRSILTPK